MTMPEKIYGWDYNGRHYEEITPVPIEQYTFIEYIRADIAQTRIEVLERALRFYAEKSYTAEVVCNGGGHGCHRPKFTVLGEVIVDQGTIAREALKDAEGRG